MEKVLGAVVAGHICLDIIPAMQAFPQGGFKDAFQPGRLIEVGAAALSTGGPVSNTGLALHGLGIPTRLICKVGADAFGRILRELIDSYGPTLSEGILVDPKTTTSYSIIVSPPDVDRIVLNNPAANHKFSADDVNYELVSRVALFHFGYPPLMHKMYIQKGQGLVDLFQRVKQTGATASLDMCYPDPTSEGGRADWVTILKATLPWVDIFMPSIEELLLMLHRDEFEQLSARGSLLDQVTPALLHSLSDELLDMGVPVVVIKIGERGLYLCTAGRKAIEKIGRAAPVDPAAWAEKELWAPCFRVRVVGTTGAGDATIAGFLSAMLRDLSPELAVTAAVAVGACNVEAADALTGLRTWDATLDRIHTDWGRLPLHLEDPAWSWDQSDQLWRRGR